MHIRKLAAFLLAAALLLSLTACSRTETVPATEKEELLAILEDIKKNFQPDTAGGALKAVGLAADLVSWAATTSMDKKETAAVVMEWLKEQSPEIRASVTQKLTSLSETCGKLLKDGASDLMESAGVESDFSNLGSRLKELIAAVLDSGGLD